MGLFSKPEPKEEDRSVETISTTAAPEPEKKPGLWDGSKSDEVAQRKDERVPDGRPSIWK